MVKECYRSLDAVLESVRLVTKIMGQITASSVEQADAILQIEQGIERISQVVQSNSATAEVSAAASEELSAQAQLLRDLTGQFCLEADACQNSGIRRSSASLIPN